MKLNLLNADVKKGGPSYDVTLYYKSTTYLALRLFYHRSLMFMARPQFEILKTVVNQRHDFVWFKLLFSLSLLCFTMLPVQAEVLNVGVVQLVDSKIDVTNMFVRIAKAIDHEVADVEFNITFHPRTEIDELLSIRAVDLVFVKIMTPEMTADVVHLNQFFLQEPIGRVSFSAYYKRGNKTMRHWVSSGFDSHERGDLSLITVDSNGPLFPDLNELELVNCEYCALEMINRGRVDAIIYATLEMQKRLENSDYRDLTSSFYRYFDMGIISRLGSPGEKYKKQLSKAIKTLKTNGELNLIMKDFNTYHNSRLSH